jgi:hypothetical protein
MPIFRTRQMRVLAERNQPGAWPRIHEMLHVTGSKMGSYAHSADGVVTITTVDNVVRADPGDWIVKDQTGTIYVHTPDNFAATFEAPPDEGSRMATLDRDQKVGLAGQRPGELFTVESSEMLEGRRFYRLREIPGGLFLRESLESTPSSAPPANQ